MRLGGEHDVVAATLEGFSDDLLGFAAREYASAVSMKLIPASRALWMIRIESSWSEFPMRPNIMAPRQ
jgi:hypothetical protein